MNLAPFLYVSLAVLSTSVIIALYRVVKGPSLQDRILALDSISYTIVGMVAVLSILMDTQVYLDIILLIGILAFLSTISYCRFIERGVVIERGGSD